MAREKKLVTVNFGGAGLLEKRSASFAFIKYLFVHTDFYVCGGMPWQELIQKEVKSEVGLPRQLSVKNPSAMQERRVQSLGQEDPLEKEMATHSRILAWEIPWTEEPGRLQSMGSQSQTRLSD